MINLYRWFYLYPVKYGPSGGVQRQHVSVGVSTTQSVVYNTLEEFRRFGEAL